MAQKRIENLHLILLAIVVAVLVWSGVAPKDRLTWVLEIAPVLIGFAILIPTYHRFRLTNLLYVLIAIHAVILCVGGRYTYAEVPIGFWVQDIFDFKRNHYDRLGHIAQGFVPAILARELFIRHKVVNGAAWRFVLVASICLAFSAVYEFIEWAAALVSDEASQAFLGTQGDNWDTQWDMFLALLGALASQLLLGQYHDRQLRAVDKARPHESF